MADVSNEPRQGHRPGRFLHGSNSDIPRALRLPRPVERLATDIHFNTTNLPISRWTGQQIVEAFPWHTAPKYMILDRAKKYGDEFIRRAESLGIKQVLISTQSPWQNPYLERVIGSIRRKSLDQVVIFSERHLRRVLRGYFTYYHGSRTHLGLEKDCPTPRPVEPPELGPIYTESMVGGLHRRHNRRAA